MPECFDINNFSGVGVILLQKLSVYEFILYKPSQVKIRIFFAIPCMHTGARRFYMRLSSIIVDVIRRVVTEVAYIEINNVDV